MRVVHPVRRALHGSHIKLIQYVRRYEPAGRYQAELTETLLKAGFGTIGFMIAATAVARICSLALLVRTLGSGNCSLHRVVLVMTSMGVMRQGLHCIRGVEE